VLRAVTCGEPPNRVTHECAEDVRKSRNVVIVLVLKVRYIHERLTRSEQLAYLLAEHARLVEQLRTLRSEFEAALLRSAHIPRHGWAAYTQRIREHRSLLANHRIALEWTRYPPCGRTNVPSPLRHLQIPFLAPSQPPRARSVAQQDKAADLAIA
jgi:hypothetical protein